MKALPFVVLFAAALPVFGGAAEDDPRAWVAGLESPYVEERIACAQRLAVLGEKAAPAIPALVALLADGNRTGRPTWAKPSRCPGEEAAKALAAIGKPAVGPLLEALKGANPTARRHAAYALGLLRATEAVEPLVALLGDPALRLPTVAALGRVGDLRAVGPLTGMMKDADPSVRLATVEALAAIRDPTCVPALTEALGDREARVRACAAGALGLLQDPRAVQPLVAATQDADPDVRAAAARSLASQPGDAPLEALTALLADKNPYVRALAAYGAGTVAARTGDKRPVPALIDCLSDSDPQVRGGAIEAFRRLHDPRAVEPLIARLDDEKPWNRMLATWAIAESYRDLRSVPALIRCLKDADARVRAGAARALGELKDPRAVPDLAECLRDGDVSVRNEAARALKGITGDDLGEGPPK